MKAKKLKDALQQMAEEGVVQVFSPNDGAPAIVGVVGALQLDVLVERLKVEYGLPVGFEQSRFELARWVSCADDAEMAKFVPRLPLFARPETSTGPRFSSRRPHGRCATSRRSGRRSPSRTSRTIKKLRHSLRLVSFRLCCRCDKPGRSWKAVAMHLLAYGSSEASDAQAAVSDRTMS